MANMLQIRAISPELPVLFTHVPKTGGSTIVGGMSRIFGRDNIAGISTATETARREFLQQCKDTGKRHVYGHFRFMDADPIYGDQANYLVALRHPLDRILSMYFQMLRADKKSELAEECLADIPGAGFEKFYSWVVTRRKQNNLMCRYICGEPDHEKAIENIKTRYNLVWSNAGIDAAWRELHKSLKGEEPKRELPRRNAAPVAESSTDFTAGARPKDYRTLLPAKNREMLENENREDIALFEWFDSQ